MMIPNLSRVLASFLHLLFHEETGTSDRAGCRKKCGIRGRDDLGPSRFRTDPRYFRRPKSIGAERGVKRS